MYAFGYCGVLDSIYQIVLTRCETIYFLDYRYNLFIIYGGENSVASSYAIEYGILFNQYRVEFDLN